MKHHQEDFNKFVESKEVLKYMVVKDMDKNKLYFKDEKEIKAEPLPENHEVQLESEPHHLIYDIKFKQQDDELEKKYEAFKQHRDAFLQ